MSTSQFSPALPLFIGCPVWNCDGWSDIVFPAGTKRSQRLCWYTQMFNCVEGNSSFYATPTVDQARRWASESAAGFQFCLKFPREISHDRALVNVEYPTGQHTPDDTHAPEMARRLWDQLRSALSGDCPTLPTPPRKPRQLELL